MAAKLDPNIWNRLNFKYQNRHVFLNKLNKNSPGNKNVFHFVSIHIALYGVSQ